MTTTDAPQIPYLMRDRPIDPRGFVTPWIVDNDKGAPIDFRVLNPERIQQAVEKRLCAMCGQRMGRYIYFLGGPLSYQNKVFNDAAMHEACARYSLVACPHLSRPAAKYSNRPTVVETTADMSAVHTRPNLFGLMKARDQHFEVHNVGGVRVPHIAPSFWVSVKWFDSSIPMAEQVNQMPMARE